MSPSPAATQTMPATGSKGRAMANPIIAAKPAQPAAAARTPSKGNDKFPKA